jgi:hypothetical protein
LLDSVHLRGKARGAPRAHPTIIAVLVLLVIVAGPRTTPAAATTAITQPM